MANSHLVNYTKLSPNHSGLRKHKIDTITIHHMAGNLSVETCGEVFANHTRKASSNYGVGSDGRVGLYVDEANRAWTSGNADNDHRAVTIEVANDGGDPDWHISDKALEKTIELCADICKRNGIEKLNFTGDKSGNLTMHKWFQATLCPGPYLESKFPYIAEEVNKRLAPKKETESFTVHVSIKDLNIRQGPGVNYASNGFIKPGVYTIVEVKDGWGKLKSGAGWISLAYTENFSGSASEPVKIEVARWFSNGYAKTWIVNANNLNMRMGAGTDKAIIKTLKRGSKFTCYGYFNNVNGTVWLYGVDKAGTLGYCSKDYLK